MHTRTIPGSIAAGPGDLSSMHMHTTVHSEFTTQYGNPRSCNIYPIIASSSTFALTPAAPLSTMSMYHYPVHYCQVREIYGGNSGNSGRQVRTYEISEGTLASAYVLHPFQTLVPRFRNGEIGDRRSKDRSKDRS